MKNKSLLTDSEIASFLAEDIGHGDITTDSIIPTTKTGEGFLLAKEDFILAGLQEAVAVFQFIDRNLSIRSYYNDGEKVLNGKKICAVKGDLRALLSGERVALNILQRMSGIATAASKYSDAAKGKLKILDTRKTVPGLRKLDKYSIRVGGCFNHRIALDDGILIKDNHIRAAGSITEAVKRVKSGIHHLLKIEVEVADHDQLREAMKAGADGVLLDNMTDDGIRKATGIASGKIFIEVSGGITLERIAALSKIGVDYISVGALTHSVRAVDISFEIAG